MEIYKKLAAARAFIKTSPMKKAGWNKYSEYWYFTPEQINALVSQAETETGLIHLFDLKRNELGIYGELTLISIGQKDADGNDITGEELIFTQITDIPQIKATNVAQQIGGAVTYTLRYMLMTAFDIVDNSLDFDAKDNKEKEENPEKEVKSNPTRPPAIVRKPMSDESFAKMCDAMRKAGTQSAAAKIQMGQTKYYTFDDQQTSITNDIIDNLQN